MSAVLTLIASPAAPLTPGDIERAADALGVPAGAPDWLAPGLAVDIPTVAPAGKVMEDMVRAALMGRPVDVALLPLAGRRKKLIIADMDSTMIGQECIDELADLVGKRDVVSAITERAMRGELDFPSALRERASMLRGLPLDRLRDTFEQRIRLNPGARSLVMTMRKHGAYTALVSGGFTYFTGKVREAAGFDYDQANVLEAENDALTGIVREPILGQDAKREALERLARDRGIDLADTLAVGDGANDLAMIGVAGLGVAFHAKPKVAAAARVRIEHGDLTALLYLQGYRQSEFHQ
jgi:phosphoserine phosphatase